MNVGELFVTLSLNEQPFRAALDAVEGSLKSFRSSLSSAAEAAAGLVKSAAVGGVVAVGGALSGAAAAGLSFNNALEQTTAQLLAMTKDAAQTEQILQMIKRRAAETPFAFSEMANAAASLLPAAKASGAELEELIALAEILAASNPAQGLEGAAFALREALSGDFVSVVERFNLPRSEINRLKKEGVPALETIRRTLEGMGLDASVVGAQARTLQGRWGRVTDTLQQLAGVATQPIFDAASETLGRFADLLERNLPTLQQYAGIIAGRLQNGITAIQPALEVAASAVQNAFGAIGILVPSATAKLSKLAPVVETAKTVLIDLWSTAQPALSELSLWFGTVKDWVMRLYGVVIERTPVVKGLFTGLGGAVQPALGAVASAVQNAFGAIGILVPSATAKLSKLTPVVETVKTVLIDLWSAAQPALSELSLLFGTVKDWVMRLYGAVIERTPMVKGLFTGLVGAATASFQQTAQTVASVLGIFRSVFNAFVPVVEAIVSVIVKFLEENGKEILAGFLAVREKINSIIVSLLEIVSAILVPTFNFLAAFIRDNQETIVEIFSRVWGVIEGIIDGALSFIGRLQDGLTAIQPALGAVASAVQNAFGAIGILVPSATAKLSELAPVVETVKTVLIDLWSAAQPALNELSLLFGTVKDWVMRLYGVVIERTPMVKGLFTGLAGAAIASFQQTAQTIASVLGIFRSVFDAFVPVVEAIVSVIVKFLEENGKEILAFFSVAREKIGSIIVTLLEIVSAILVPTFNFLAAFIRDNQETIVEIFSRVWGAIEGIVVGALSFIEGLLKSVLALLKGDTDTALVELSNSFGAAFEGIKRAFSSLFDWAAPFVSEQIRKLTEIVTGFFNDAVRTITELPEKIKGAVVELGGTAVGGVSAAFQLPQLPQLPFFGQPNQTRTVNVTVNAQYPSSNRSLFDDVALVTRVVR